MGDLWAELEALILASIWLFSKGPGSCGRELGSLILEGVVGGAACFLTF